VDKGQEFICYLSNNSEFDQYTPKFAQRLVIKNYCKHFDISHNGWQFENEYLYHLPIFEHLLDQPIKNIIVYSMYSVTDKLLKLAVNKNKTIHFANEFMICNSKSSL
jgi:hypothetical protein